MTTGLQYDGTRQTGAALLSAQDAQTFGISMELTNEEIGLHMLAAFNQDNGNTGATGLILGGGPFFTSMEDQTLDAIGEAGSAWLIGAGYHFDKAGIPGLNAGLAYGHFEAKADNAYESSEVDIVLEYTFSEALSVTVAFALVKFDHGVDENNQALNAYKQFRLIANYNL